MDNYKKHSWGRARRSQEALQPQRLGKNVGNFQMLIIFSTSGEHPKTYIFRRAAQLPSSEVLTQLAREKNRGNHSFGMRSSSTRF